MNARAKKRLRSHVPGETSEKKGTTPANALFSVFTSSAEDMFLAQQPQSRHFSRYIFLQSEPLNKLQSAEIKIRYLRHHVELARQLHAVSSVSTRIVAAHFSWERRNTAKLCDS